MATASAATPAAASNSTERADIAVAMDHIRAAVLALRGLGGLDLDQLVEMIALGRLLGSELGRLLESRRGYPRQPPTWDRGWSVIVEERIASAQARLSAELDA